WKIPAYGGKEPVRLMVTGGSLPPGLNLSPDGALSGTPKAAGSFAFSVSATDSCKSGQQSATRAYRLGVADSPAGLAAISQSILMKGPLSIAAVPTPASVTISSGRESTSPVSYLITAKSPETATLTSPGATFRAGGTVIGSVPVPLTVSLINGTAEISEIVTISRDILERARRENAGKMHYSRPFIGRGTTALAVIEITLPMAAR
ncbi:MAG: Ig domain-containing protein, partial [Methanomicrobiales archaeon]|nr:Ig domain-containing protein [Methanomicrobiales archaeon]